MICPKTVGVCFHAEVPLCRPLELMKEACAYWLSSWTRVVSIDPGGFLSASSTEFSNSRVQVGQAPKIAEVYRLASICCQANVECMRCAQVIGVASGLAQAPVKFTAVGSQRFTSVCQNRKALSILNAQPRNESSDGHTTTSVLSQCHCRRA